MFAQQTFKSDILANALGSLMAGVTAGYLSHVPHNMSTLKLLSPNKSYGQLVLLEHLLSSRDRLD